MQPFPPVLAVCPRSLPIRTALRTLLKVSTEIEIALDQALTGDLVELYHKVSIDKIKQVATTRYHLANLSGRNLLPNQGLSEAD